ncbi:MAG: AbrB/MazE/SpoVT family DNA-binding domain-containing protein [Acidobacteria bacterium]|nr:AbrB/MazE/SpoVT family DNA-binding domain-containing protein [Acidobacteriota bacterium]MBV9625133.1 AbrB/MazE/SpoVT family DNA-binding domain-containing protein [Acidobacteriota bacterium]
MGIYHCPYEEKAVKGKRARVFWTGRSQAVRLPKEFRFETDTVLVHREGRSVVVEPVSEWPEGYVESFAGIADDFVRPPQRKVDKRTSLR